MCCLAGTPKQTLAVGQTHRTLFATPFAHRRRLVGRLGSRTSEPPTDAGRFSENTSKRRPFGVSCLQKTMPQQTTVADFTDRDEESPEFAGKCPRAVVEST